MKQRQYGGVDTLYKWYILCCYTVVCSVSKGKPFSNHRYTPNELLISQSESSKVSTQYSVGEIILLLIICLNMTSEQNSDCEKKCIII